MCDVINAPLPSGASAQIGVACDPITNGSRLGKVTAIRPASAFLVYATEALGDEPGRLNLLPSDASSPGAGLAPAIAPGATSRTLAKAASRAGGSDGA